MNQNMFLHDRAPGRKPVAGLSTDFVRAALWAVTVDPVASKKVFNSPEGIAMSKLLSAMLAAVFAVVTVTPVVYAADKADEGKEMKKDTKKKSSKKKEGGETKKEDAK